MQLISAQGRRSSPLIRERQRQQGGDPESALGLKGCWDGFGRLARCRPQSGAAVHRRLTSSDVHGSSQPKHWRPNSCGVVLERNSALGLALHVRHGSRAAVQHREASLQRRSVIFVARGRAAAASEASRQDSMAFSLAYLSVACALCNPCARVPLLCLPLPMHALAFRRRSVR